MNKKRQTIPVEVTQDLTPKQARKLLQLTFFYTVIIIILGSLTNWGGTFLTATIIFIIAVAIQPKIAKRKK